MGYLSFSRGSSQVKLSVHLLNCEQILYSWATGNPVVLSKKGSWKGVLVVQHSEATLGSDTVLLRNVSSRAPSSHCRWLSSPLALLPLSFTTLLQIGDVLWYLSLSLNALRRDLEEVSKGKTHWQLRESKGGDAAIGLEACGYFERKPPSSMLWDAEVTVLDTSFYTQSLGMRCCGTQNLWKTRLLSVQHCRACSLTSINVCF